MFIYQKEMCYDLYENNIKQLIKESGLTIWNTAKLSGVSRFTLEKLCNGQLYSLGKDKMESIANVLNVPFESLAPITEPPKEV